MSKKNLRIKLETKVRGNYKKIFDSFDETLFLKLAPPLTKIFIRSFEGCQKGDEVSFSMKTLGFQMFWEGLIVDSSEGDKEIYFIDIGKKMPFPLESWNHRHEFHRISDNETLLVDDLEFSCKFRIFDYLLFPFWFGYFIYRSFLYKKMY